MKWILTILCIVLLFVMNIICGSVHINLSDVAAVLSGQSNDEIISFIIIQSRFPQAVTALFVGSALASAGLLLQTTFHNPLAGPSVLGISGGASLGVALVVLCGITSPFGSIGASFLGASVVTFLLLYLNSIVKNKLVLLIIGLLLGYLISAVITILNTIATPENLQHYVMWGMGDFSSVTLRQLPFFSIALLLLMVGALLMMKPLNALQLGDFYAKNMGIDVKLMRNLILAVVGGITALTTAFCGPVAFIGLAVPHIARMVVRTDDFRRLMPMTLLTGSAVALLCNLLCTVPSNTLLPLNAVTPIVGVPVIIYVVTCGMRKFH